MAGGTEQHPAPLCGRTVVVTRPRAQAEGFCSALEDLGARAVLFPTIRIAAPENAEPLRRAARAAGEFDWIVFTSVNGVDRFFRALAAEGLGADALGRDAGVACIGPATADTARERGLEVDILPPRYVAEALLEQFSAGDVAGRRMLLPRAAAARPVLARGLEERGAIIREVAAYRAVPAAEGAGRMRAQLRDGDIDALTFTASSTVRNFVDAVGSDVGRAAVAAIGPITAGTARRRGLPVHIEAEEHTIPGLTDALVQHFGR